MALAIDSVSQGNIVGSSANLNISHTCAALARLYVVISGLPPVGDITSVTYNSVAMTKAVASTSVNAFRTCEIWYMDNPSSGTNTISIAHSSPAQYISGFGISFTGAAAASLGATSNNATGGATSISQSISSTVAASYLVTGYYFESSGTISKSGSESFIGSQINDGVGGYSGAATTILTTSVGSYTPAASGVANTQWRMVTVEVKGPPATAVPSLFVRQAVQRAANY